MIVYTRNMISRCNSFERFPVNFKFFTRNNIVKVTKPFVELQKKFSVSGEFLVAKLCIDPAYPIDRKTSTEALVDEFIIRS